MSTHKQKARGDLGRQGAHIRGNLQDQDVSHVVEIMDVGSGLSERRPGLLRLMEMARWGEVRDRAVTYRDRLTRFGYGYLQEFFSGYGVRIRGWTRPRSCGCCGRGMRDARPWAKP